MRYETTATRKRGTSRQGAAALLAMLFLVLLATLSVAMYEMGALNLQGARNLSEAGRASQAAESGLRWMAWRFVKMSRPKTTIGNITPAVAAGLWAPIRTSLQSDFATMMTASERTLSGSGTTLTSNAIKLDGDGASFQLTISQHPLSVDDPLDERYVRVTSKGMFDGATRSVSMEFKIDKRSKFAVVGKVPIQLGRNTLVEGPVAMATPNKYPPILCLSDFRNLNNTLKTRIDSFESFLKANHTGYDNRISASNATEWTKATTAGYSDRNGDRFIDEYDLFLGYYDANGDAKITKAEFTNNATGKLYDENLFAAMDSLGGPMFSGDVTRAGYQDDVIDNSDAYAKINGSVVIATSADAWSSNLSSSGSVIQDMLQGPVIPPNTGEIPVKFGATSSDIFDLAPSNFDTSSFRTKTGPQNGTTARAGAVITNAVIATSDSNSGTVDERTPYGSTSYQATYRRPVYRNITFRNCRIPKGINALFDNCTFEGVTYVEMVTNITSGSTTTTSATDGKTWSQRMKSGSFNKSTVLTTTNSKGFDDGNNLRFNNCTLKGPIASDVPTAYTHFGNSWEFTGATLFNNLVDATATIVAPQTNIEMGSFTDPTLAPSTLVGVVVAGNIDIRGTSVVDGSIIVTGDGAGNTTLGWFGSADDATDASAPLPEGGFGRLSVRYNPNRALPDGINIAIDILPVTSTYTE